MSYFISYFSMVTGTDFRRSFLALITFDTTSRRHVAVKLSTACWGNLVLTTPSNVHMPHPRQFELATRRHMSMPCGTRCESVFRGLITTFIEKKTLI